MGDVAQVTLVLRSQQFRKSWEKMFQLRAGTHSDRLCPAKDSACTPITESAYCRDHFCRRLIRISSIQDPELLENSGSSGLKTGDIIVNGDNEETVMNNKRISTLLIGLFLLGCDFSVSTFPTPTPLAPATLTFITTGDPFPGLSLPATEIPVFTLPSIPPVAANVCADPQVTTLIDSLKRAMLTSDGALLGSLVSPNGMEVRWVRYGNIVTYDQEQSKFTL